MFKFIRKRDNQIVPFEIEKITSAILKAGEATGEFNDKIANQLTLHVINLAQQIVNDRTCWGNVFRPLGAIQI